MSELSNYIDEYLKTEYTLKSTLKDSVQSSVYLYQKNDSAKQIVKINQKTATITFCDVSEDNSIKIPQRYTKCAQTTRT